MMVEKKEEQVYGKVVDSFDEAFTHVGCGSVQLKQHFLFFLMCVPFAYQSLFMVFACKDPKWRCTENSTSCRLQGNFGPESANYDARCRMKRSEWEFVEAKEWSLVTKFDLVCDKAIWVNLAGSAFFLGAVFGALLFGWAADRFGRKKVLWCSLLLAHTASALSSFAPNIWIFTGLRLSSGFYYYGVALALTILSCEIVSPKYRAMSGVSLWIYFAVGLVLLGVQAYFIQRWQLLGLITTVPYLVVFLFYKFIPESIRWLWVTGHEEKSQAMLSEIAQTHKKPPLSLDGMKSKRKGSDPKPSSNKAFGSRQLVFQTIIQGYLWFVQGLLYYGFFLVSDNLSGHLYHDFILTSVMDIPANIFSIFCSRRFSRRWSFLGSVIISAVSCVGIACLSANTSQSVTYIRLTLGLIGKFFVSNGSNLLYVWSPEIYPTVVRSKAMGIFSALRPLGGAVAPWVTTLLLVYHSSLPFVVLAGLSFVEIFVCLLLPETKGMPLKDDFQEIGMDNEGCQVGEIVIDKKDNEKSDSLTIELTMEYVRVSEKNKLNEDENIDVRGSSSASENEGFENDDNFTFVYINEDDGRRNLEVLPSETKLPVTTQIKVEINYEAAVESETSLEEEVKKAKQSENETGYELEPITYHQQQRKRIQL